MTAAVKGSCLLTGLASGNMEMVAYCLLLAVAETSRKEPQLATWALEEHRRVDAVETIARRTAG